MPFNSFVYLLAFLPVVAGVHGLLRSRASQPWSQAWLLLASLFFYAFGRPSNLPLLVASILFNWAIARAMMAEVDEIRRKRVLLAGLVANVSFLCVFKYVNFFLSTAAALGGPRWSLPDWELPLGISFFTLTQVMYLVDTYQGLNGVNSLFDHATLVSLFPYITAGPLVRSRAVVPAFHKLVFPEPRLDLACRGLYLFTLGLTKKVVFADSFANVADVGFGMMARDFSSLEAWVFSLAYTFQMYFDFSGYSDMALGSAWMLGVDIPQNFNAPYRSRSLSEFWQRWHISLSNFITNYLYTPILRSMGKATLRTSMVATLLAMGIAGLWHGPAWTYVVWGLLHGTGLAINQFWKRRRWKMPNWLGWLLTFSFVNLTLIFFRSSTVGSAMHLISAMLPHANLFGVAALRNVLPLTPMVLVHPVVIGIGLAFFFKTSSELAKAFRPSPAMAGAVAALMLLSLFFMNSSPAKQFLYWAF
jgi:D-alanyl-lipoteichoic acid acyltransferase DltB (MBOAT superfamily)